MMPKLLILGTRGIPARHGGFETFAEHLAPYLVKNGWEVVVYCQTDSVNSRIMEDKWHGVRRILIPAPAGSLGTIIFDWKCISHAIEENGLVLLLGYNTAIFALRLIRRSRRVIINMDGIEWRRDKWSRLAKIWLYLNERIASKSAHSLIADHPEIARHLTRHKGTSPISVIAYGADNLVDVPTEPLKKFNLTPRKYIISIGRIEPENNVSMFIKAFAQEERTIQLICVGGMEPERNSYHKSVLDASLGRVIFPGAVYDRSEVAALRYHAAAYIHGHSVGGTNPSLVEALGAGNVVLAHDNLYNRWVAGPEQIYFNDVTSCAEAISTIETHSDLGAMRSAARNRFQAEFTWPAILRRYENLLLSAID